MKRTPLTRKAPLKRSKWMRRRPSGSLPLQTRLAVLDRAQAKCERCRVDGRYRGLEVHHRRLRAQGGSDDVSNLVALCGGPQGCHRWAHENPARAKAEGWIIGVGMLAIFTPRENDVSVPGSHDD